METFEENVDDSVQNFNDSELVEAVALYPALSDVKLSHYHNTSVKSRCWELVSQKVNHPVDICMSRWLRLKDNFRREKNKRELESRSGQGLSNRKGFALYASMGFIHGHMKKRQSFTNVQAKRTKSQSTPSSEWGEQYQHMSPPTYTPLTTVPKLFPTVNQSLVTTGTLPVYTESMIISTAPTILTEPGVITVTSTPAVQPTVTSTSITPAELNTMRHLPITPSTPVRTCTPLASPSVPHVRVPQFSPNTMSSPSNLYNAMSPSMTSHSSTAPSSPADSLYSSVYSDVSCDFNVDHVDAVRTRNSYVSVQKNCPMQSVSSSLASTSVTLDKQHNTPATPKKCYTKDSLRQKKHDPLEACMISLSNTIKGKLEAESAPKQANRTPDQVFGNMVAGELSRMDDADKANAKSLIVDIIFARHI